METEFITYDQAIKLSDLGFNEKCFCYYDTCNQFRSLFTGATPEILKNEGVVAPLKQQVFRWFREKHNLSGIPTDESYEIWILTDGVRECIIEEYPILNFEEAETSCIDKLISIIKTK